MLLCFAIVFLNLIPAFPSLNPCSLNGDSENCTLFIQNRRNKSRQEVDQARTQIRELEQAGKIDYDQSNAPIALHELAMTCFSIGQIPIHEGDCAHCVNCVMSYGPDVCQVFCPEPAQTPGPRIIPPSNDTCSTSGDQRSPCPNWPKILAVVAVGLCILLAVLCILLAVFCLKYRQKLIGVP